MRRAVQAAHTNRVICITGGAGYIGTHIAFALLESCPDRRVLCVDTLENSTLDGLMRLERCFAGRLSFRRCDVRDAVDFENAICRLNVSCVIHCAGYKDVGESMARPLEYYDNNLGATMSVLKVMRRLEIERLLFCSSCTVYGLANAPYEECRTPCHPVSPYGRTKWFTEQLLTDFCLANPRVQAVVFRCFNPAGAHPSGLIGEAETNPTNLLPLAFQVCLGKRAELVVFGGDYENSPDGTCQRDFLHVSDVADAHVAVVDEVLSPGMHVFNLGSGRPTTVLQMIAEVEKAAGRKVLFQIGRRRPGDVSVSYCSVEKAARELGWKPKRDLNQICFDQWRFLSKMKS